MSANLNKLDEVRNLGPFFQGQKLIVCQNQPEVVLCYEILLLSLLLTFLRNNTQGFRLENNNIKNPTHFRKIYQISWVTGLQQLPPMLIANRFLVETVLLLAEDKGGGINEAVLGDSKREGKVEVWRWE